MASVGDTMSEQVPGRRSIPGRAVEEFKALLALTLYLYVCFGAVVLYKSAILSEAGISITVWGIAIVKALILAKFMLLGRMMHLGARYRHKPLIWPTLHRSLMYLILLLILTTIEELIVGYFHGRAVHESLNHVVGPIFFQGIAVCFLMFLILVPYSAFTCLGDVLGEREVLRLFFVSRNPAPKLVYEAATETRT